ncbi:Transcriptional regulator [Candidatus Methanophagaceae archaeon]|nr:Transcriptional regulator [Methanophagales archaeon]
MRTKNAQERKEHVTIWLETSSLDYLDALVERGVFENRSQAVRHAVRSFINMDKGLAKFIDLDNC